MPFTLPLCQGQGDRPGRLEVAWENNISRGGGEGGRLKRADKGGGGVGWGWIRSLCTNGVNTCMKKSVKLLNRNKLTELLPKLS